MESLHTVLLRIRERLSQTEIARRTGIPQPRLSRWERGEVPAGADDALKLLKLASDLTASGEPVAGDTPATPDPTTQAAA